MGSERRRRGRILTVRLYDDQDAYIEALVANQPGAMTRADVARHILFGDPLPNRPSCGPKHGAHCTDHHAELVHGYRWERDRQEQLHEAATGGYAGDAALAAENGAPPLITFADWLSAHNNHDGEP